MDLSEALQADRKAHDHRDGISAAEDARLAFEHFEQARAGGLVYAVHDVAWCHYWGLGTPRDAARSAAVLSEAIERFPTWLVFRIPLAAQYALGAGVPRDEALCEQLLLEAGSRLRADDTLRQAWLAAWSGDPAGEYAIACASAPEHGAAIWQLRERGRWLRLAAEAGFAEAQYQYAKLLESKAHGPRDLRYRSAASNWKWKAAWQKHELALRELREAGDGLMGALQMDEFDELIQETGITFTPPAGFEPFPVRDQCGFRYQRAYRHANGTELRVRIDSLQGAAPNMSEMTYVAAIFNLSGGEAQESGDWPDDKARACFNADWVRQARFRPADPLFAPEHDTAIVHYFHREGIADVYYIGLYNEGSDGARLILGDEAPIQFPEYPAAAVEDRAEFRKLWDAGAALIEGCLNLDGHPTPPLDDSQRGRLRQAVGLFLDAAELEPANAGPWLMIGKATERLDDFEASLEAFRRAHERAPDSAMLIIELGAALGRCGRHEEAIAVLSAGAEQNPTEPRLHCNLGLELLMAGNADAAASAFGRLLELEPDAPNNSKLLMLALDVEDGRKPVPRSEAEVAALL
jgi:tetratricopeptide (TPR) repeat protein